MGTSLLESLSYSSNQPTPTNSRFFKHNTTTELRKSIRQVADNEKVFGTMGFLGNTVLCSPGLFYFKPQLSLLSPYRSSCLPLGYTFTHTMKYHGFLEGDPDLLFSNFRDAARGFWNIDEGPLMGHTDIPFGSISPEFLQCCDRPTNSFGWRRLQCGTPLIWRT